MRAFGLPAGPLVVALAAAALSGCAAAAHTPPLGSRGAPPVILWANCTPNGFEARATPWVVEVPLGSDVEWRVDPSSPVEEVRIIQIDDWPFNGPPPHARKNNPGQGRGMKNGVKVNDRFVYGLQFSCPDGRRVLLDPDMIIVNGT